MFNAHPGEFVGALAVLTGEPSIFTIKAKQHTRLAVMTSAAFYSYAIHLRYVRNYFVYCIIYKHCPCMLASG